MSAALGQFGVNGLENRRDWSPLTETEARSALAEFTLPAQAQTILWHGQRPFSATGLIQLQNGQTVFLKRHDRRLRTARAIAEEHRFIAHLQAAALPVSTPLATASGDAALAVGAWVYEAFLPLDGLDLYRNTPSWEPYRTTAHAHAAGLMLGRLHRAARTFDAPCRHDRLLISSLDTLPKPDLVTAVADWIPTQPGLEQALARYDWRADMVRTIGPFHDALRPHLTALRPCWGHGDWHGSNLFWSGDIASATVTGVFDFGMSDRTCAPFDLAVAIERSFIHWLDPGPEKTLYTEQLRTFLRGYLTEHPMTADEKALTLALLPLVHVEFALSEVAYYAALVRDPASATIAYDGYLLGHAAWFASPQGQGFRQHLAAMLETG